MTFTDYGILRVLLFRSITDMNHGGFSWKRFIGISALKAKISRKIGIPLTKSGRQRKLGAFIIKCFYSFFFAQKKEK